jgi:hypothetical protein
MVNNPPNSPGLLITPYSSLNNFRQVNIRLDQNIGDKVRVYARYMQDVVPQNSPFSLWGGGNYPGVETTSINAPGRNLVINATATISPRVVNEVEFVDAWGAINSDLTNALANSPAFTGQLTNNTAFADPYGRAPNVSISGYTGLGNGSAPYHERNISKTIFDNLSIQHGNHTIRVGFTSMWMQKTENGDGGAANFNFSSRYAEQRSVVDGYHREHYRVLLDAALSSLSGGLGHGQQFHRDPRRSERKCQWPEVRYSILQHFRIR